MPESHDNPTLEICSSMANDTLRGAKEIGDFTGDGERRVRYLISIDELPVYRVGGIYHMRKSQYQEMIREREQAYQAEIAQKRLAG